MSKGKASRNKARGTDREYKAIRLLKKRRWQCIRSAGSHGPFDVVAVKRERIRFIQVKSKGIKLSPKEREEISNFECPDNCTKELWTDVPYKGFDVKQL